MSQFIPIILAAGLISFIATPLVRRLAQKLNFVAHPGAQRFHTNPTPMLGGLAIYAGLIVAVFLSRLPSYRELLAVLGGATVMTLFGVWDDRHSLSPVMKLLGQAIATALLIWGGIQVSLFRLPALDIAITFLWVIGICNAINFQDNMDGLAAGLATIASAFFLVLAVVEGLGLVAALAAAMVGACVGFLYYNFNPASLFMGDAGSLLIGFVLAVLGIKLQFVGRPLAVTWMIPIIILGVPIFDMTLVVLSRIRRGKHIYQGGTDHTSHRLVSVMGMTTARAVMTLYLVASSLGLIALMVRDATPLQARLILAVLAVIFVAGIVWLEWRFANGKPPSAQSDPDNC